MFRKDKFEVGDKVDWDSAYRARSEEYPDGPLTVSAVEDVDPCDYDSAGHSQFVTIKELVGFKIERKFYTFECDGVFSGAYFVKAELKGEDMRQLKYRVEVNDDIVARLAYSSDVICIAKAYAGAKWDRVKVFVRGKKAWDSSVDDVSKISALLFAANKDLVADGNFTEGENETSN